MACHLTLQKRELVSQMHHAGSKPTEIARRLNRHPSTISRELRRNRGRNGYWAVAAQTKAEARRGGRPWICKLDHPEVSRYVRERLRQYWSPDQIAGRSRSDFPDDPRRHVSRQTISPGFTRNTPQGPTGAATCDVWDVCGGAGKIAANCRPASRSRGVRQWSIAGLDAVIGKATRWSARVIAAERSRWWSESRDTCRWARSVIGTQQPFVGP